MLAFDLKRSCRTGPFQGQDGSGLVDDGQGEVAVVADGVEQGNDFGTVVDRVGLVVKGGSDHVDDIVVVVHEQADDCVRVGRLQHAFIISDDARDLHVCHWSIGMSDAA